MTTNAPEGALRFSCPNTRLEATKEWVQIMQGPLAPPSAALPCKVQELLVAETNRLFPMTPAFESSSHAVYSLGSKGPTPTTTALSDSIVSGDIVVIWVLGAQHCELSLVNADGAVVPMSEDDDAHSHRDATPFLVLRGEALASWRVALKACHCGCLPAVLVAMGDLTARCSG